MGMLTGISVPRSTGSGSATPSGPAGGDLTGTYPSPTLVTSGVTAATYGSATQVPVFAVDAKGRITTVTNTAITGFLSALPVQATYVDKVNGSDGTGVAGRFDKPYLTIQAAITATTAPLPVYVRASATDFDEKITLKNNVPVIMEKGATLTYTGASGATVTYPGTSGENYILLGHGRILSAASTGGDAVISGGVSGTGYMILEADAVIGQGTNGNRAMNLLTAQIDPSTVAVQPSYIKVQYVESNNKVSNYAIDIDWAGGPAYLWYGTINNISATAGSRAFQITGQSGLGDYALDLFIDKVVDTASTAAVGQDSVHLINNGGGVTPFTCTINYIMAGNKCALGIADNVWVRAVLVQNNSSSVPTVHGEVARITGALIQNISNNASTTPIIDTNIYDDRILYEDCRFENPNSNPSDSPIKLANFAGTFDRFKDCVFYLASTDADGLINLEKSDGANFIGNNIILRRTGSAPSIGAASAKVARVYGNLFVNPDKDADITVLGGNIIYDSAMVIGNSISTYWA